MTDAPPSPATSEQIDGYDDLVRAEQVRLLYEGLLVSTTGSTAGALVIVLVLWQVAPRTAMLAWFAVMVANQAWRVWLYAAYRRKGSLAAHEVRRWGLYWTIGSGLSGCIWGAASFLLFAADAPIAQAVLIVLIFALTSAAVLLTGSYLPAFYAFVLPALVPVVARNVMVGDAMHNALAGFALISAMAIVSFGRNYNLTLARSLRTRFHNERLAAQLARQNAELEQARRVAEEANRSKTQFFAAASHDLRQPLHAMGLFASALAEKVSDPAVNNLIASIVASVQALEALFNELLDISKIDSGVIKPDLHNFALIEVLDRLRDGFAAEAAARKLQLTVGSGDFVVFSDPLLLDRILRNLISNAIRYTPSGEVGVDLESAGDRMRITVRDSGIGIPEEHRQKVFDEFFQVANPGRTSKKGLGLGLAIVKRLCDLLGYTVQLYSPPGGGSRFSFEVPLGRPEAAPRRADDSPSLPLADLSGRLCVVVDDEAAIIEGMQTLLSGWGMKVVTSNSGDDVVAAVHDIGAMPDLLIVDYRLGAARNGIEVVQDLRRALDPEIPAILISGSMTPDLAQHAGSAGLECILKPVTADVLRQRIQAVLAKRAG
jgi:signal transduction histidine kinase/CheY-like chemotaxis protein